MISVGDSESRAASAKSGVAPQCLRMGRPVASPRAGSCRFRAACAWQRERFTSTKSSTLMCRNSAMSAMSAMTMTSAVADHCACMSKPMRNVSQSLSWHSIAAYVTSHMGGVRWVGDAANEAAAASMAVANDTARSSVRCRAHTHADGASLQVRDSVWSRRCALGATTIGGDVSVVDSVSSRLVTTLEGKGIGDP